MKNYSINKEDLVYVDEISKSAQIIIKYAEDEYKIPTF
ncbi:hypothetical protein MJ1_0378 [Nanobdella aerobiophila]|uniref:Uncharacterized protein n=1 Tax=Nanobdella aerobiophila TaxID=2586965 RepID=A0A915SIC3_9ARCH|nr:hypothetical protein MJ1_0378 [Nanobdella aerobiophila]